MLGFKLNHVDKRGHCLATNLYMEPLLTFFNQALSNKIKITMKMCSFKKSVWKMSTQTNDMTKTMQNTTLLDACAMVSTPHDRTWIISGDLVLMNKASKRREVSSAILANAIWKYSQPFIAHTNQMCLHCMKHYNDVIMSAMAYQITSLAIVYPSVYSCADQRKTSKLRVTGLCAGNSPTGDWWIPHTNGQ